MSQLVVNSIEDFINSIDFSTAVESFSDDGTYTTVVCDNIYHARGGMKVDVDGMEYKVRTSDPATDTLELNGLITDPVTVTIPTPQYFHGTLRAANGEVSQLDPLTTFPMIYLWEIVKEDEQDIFSAIDREAGLRFFFIDEANNEDWLVDDYYKQRLEGLNKLVDKFKSSLLLDKGNYYTDEVTFTRVQHPNWGEYKDLKGHVKLLFDGYFAAVEYDFTLPFRKGCN